MALHKVVQLASTQSHLYKKLVQYKSMDLRENFKNDFQMISFFYSLRNGTNYSSVLQNTSWCFWNLFLQSSPSHSPLIPSRSIPRENKIFLITLKSFLHYPDHLTSAWFLQQMRSIGALDDGNITKAVVERLRMSRRNIALRLWRDFMFHARIFRHFQYFQWKHSRSQPCWLSNVFWSLSRRVIFPFESRGK